MPTATGATALCAALLAAAPAAPGQPLRLGAMGDSLTDEYAEESYDYAVNWSMLLVQRRAVTMGPTAAAAGQPGGTWGEPRRTGYAFNWARYDADSATALTQGQHAGLAAQVTPQGITHAVIAIGANDFAPTSSAYFSIYWGLWSTGTVDAYVATRIANITSAVDTLDQTGVGLIIGNCVDFGGTPIVRQLYANASRRDRVTNVIARVNAGVATLAQQRRAVHLDLNTMARTILGSNAAPRQFLPVGGVNIQLLNRDTASHGNPLAGFVDDGGHPHTALQGLFANAVMTALNTGWPGEGGATINPPASGGGLGFALLSDQEILAAAGLSAPGGNAQTSLSVTGPLVSYVTSHRCAADIGRQGGIAGGDGALDNNDFVVFIDRFFSLDPRVDMGVQGGIPGHDGQLDTNDFVVFVDRFFTGC